MYGRDFAYNPFEQPIFWRKKIIEYVKLTPNIMFDGKGFICVLINSRCHIACEHCMFFSNMNEGKNSINTLTDDRLSKLMLLINDSNTGYLLVTGGGEGFLEMDLMYRIVEETNADITWMVTSAYWATDYEHARNVISEMYGAFIKGNFRKKGRKICLRISLDVHHVKNITHPNQQPLQYILNLINIFETEYTHENNFILQIHTIEGEESLVNELCKVVSGKKLDRHDPLHDNVKVTESAITVKLESGYEFEVTFAKLLLSDLAADLRDKEKLKKRIEVFEKDAFHNERGKPAIKHNQDDKIGPNMLVVYNGRISGGWQSEMPDVSINLDIDDFESIMQKTLTDPGVLGTVENGLAYRFDIIQEVCPKAVLRSKAANIRDYTSPILLEEDKIKLYYCIRVLQDFVAQSRVKENELKEWPPEILSMVSMTKSELQKLYHNSKYDIIQQFIESEKDYRFGEFIRCIKQYIQVKNLQIILNFFLLNPGIPKRIVDKWRLLLERIVNDWYDLHTFRENEFKAIEEIKMILDIHILEGKRYYEGLSNP